MFPALQTSAARLVGLAVKSATKHLRCIYRVGQTGCVFGIASFAACRSSTSCICRSVGGARLLTRRHILPQGRPDLDFVKNHFQPTFNTTIFSTSPLVDLTTHPLHLRPPLSLLSRSEHTQRNRRLNELTFLLFPFLLPILLRFVAASSLAWQIQFTPPPRHASFNITGFRSGFCASLWSYSRPCFSC